MVALVSLSMHGNVAFAAAQQHARAFDELAVHEDVLQVVVAGILPQGSDGRQPAGRLRVAGGDGRDDDEKEECGPELQPHILILLCALPCGPR